MIHQGRWRHSVDWYKAHKRGVHRTVTFVFIAIVVGFIAYAATHVDWQDVIDAIWDTPNSVLGLALAISICSYLVYSCLDLLGRMYTGHHLAWWRSNMVGIISYAFTMNMGAPVGGIGLRLRLYSKQGLGYAEIFRVMAMSLSSNWIGYTMVAGIVFMLGGIRLPSDWGTSGIALRVVGAVMATVILAYVYLCAFSRKRSWKLRDHEIELPSWRIAVLQVAVAGLNWCLMAATIYVLMQQQVPYVVVLGALLVSAVAGVVAHIPGGVGVLESVFIALLASGELPRSQILAALLMYRAVYYLIPLFLAGAWYLLVEVIMEKKHAPAPRT